MALDQLGQCPVCQSSDRTPAYRATSDGVFGSEGAWDYWACGCGLLYLDPRPAAEDMAALYAHYYTHQSSPAPLRWREPGFRGAVRRGYLNRRYGYRLPNASRIGGLTWRLRRAAVKNLDYMIRHLPAPHRAGDRLLDIGCGNGAFLEVARDLGFAAEGIEPDPQAAERARARGLVVASASLPGSGAPQERFDHVLMSHVLEHLADPRAALAEALALLVPGGRLWLSAPNVASAGLRQFGRHWRGLEPPRHLVLFDRPRLEKLLRECGYERIRLLPPEDAAFFYFRQSLAIATGVDPRAASDPPGWAALRRRAAEVNRRARRDPAEADTVTMIAFRPPS